MASVIRALIRRSNLKNCVKQNCVYTRMAGNEQCVARSLSSDSQKITLPGRVQLSYVQQGSGSHALLCIPGALGTVQTDFSPQVEYFGREGSEFTVVAFDPRGYGASRPPERSFHTGDEHFLTTDGHDGYHLMKTLGFDTFSVLGWSDGGVSAVVLAANYPESVKSLAVWGSNAYISSQDVELFEGARDISNWSKRMREPLEAIYGASFPQLWSDWVDSMWELYKTRKDAGLILDELSMIRCPLLVLHGEQDPLCPKFHAEFLRDNVANSELYMFPKGKHNIHLRYAHEFNTVVEEFLLRQ